MIDSTSQSRRRVVPVTGQRVTILCPDGEFVIEAPRALGVRCDALMKKARGWVCDWTPAPNSGGERIAWTESISRLDALRGVERLRRTMTLLMAEKLEAAIQEAEHLPELYMPVWVLLQAEATRRG
jgi:hypothetical protein